MSFLGTPLKAQETDRFETIFRIGMAWRIVYGSFRLILGFILLHHIGTPLSHIFYKIMSHELIQDPHDFLLNTIHPILEHSSLTVTYFLASYLIFWGVIDVVLSISMLRHIIWSFPVSIYLIILFVIYELYRFMHTHSIILLGIIVIDIVLVWIIRREYLKLRMWHSREGGTTSSFTGN